MHKKRNNNGPMSKWLAFVAGLLLGALGGATAMLLLAPRSGKKTRSQIQKQGAKAFEQASDSMDGVMTEAGDKAHEFADSVQEEVGDLQKQAKGLFSKGRK